MFSQYLGACQPLFCQYPVHSRDLFTSVSDAGQSCCVEDLNGGAKWNREAHKCSEWSQMVLAAVSSMGAGMLAFNSLEMSIIKSGE